MTKPGKLGSAASISALQMKDAIQRSGYLLEQRVERRLAGHGYLVQANPAYPDPDTGKSREIDINAMSAVHLYKKGMHCLFPILLCECENNAQPVVFFTKKSEVPFLHHEEVKMSGIPVKFWQKDEYVSLSEFAKMKDFHHYCKGTVATQYCSFQQQRQDKSCWLALHNDEQHRTLHALVKYLKNQTAAHFSSWVRRNTAKIEAVKV